MSSRSRLGEAGLKRQNLGAERTVGSSGQPVLSLSDQVAEIGVGEIARAFEDFDFIGLGAGLALVDEFLEFEDKAGRLRDEESKRSRAGTSGCP